MLVQLSSRRATDSHGLVELLGECHQRIRHFVGLACAIARRRDVPADEVIRACAEVTRYFTQAFPLHLADEEESIEPRLRGSSPELDRALDAMRAQHGAHAPNTERLLAALTRVQGAPLDETARNELAMVAEQLKRELEEHLALEERVIFPAIRTALPLATQAMVVDELRQRRTSPGRQTPSNAAEENQP